LLDAVFVFVTVAVALPREPVFGCCTEEETETFRLMVALVLAVLDEV
jgi:hypothetical protein